MPVHYALAVLPFVALAYGGPLIGRNPQLCNTGTVQCCQSVQSAGSPGVGLACTSLSGAGSTGKCGSNPVCCNETHYNGLINMGCTSMSL